MKALIASLGLLMGCSSPEAERLYRAQCADCHGPRGEGGRGPSLNRPALRHAPDEAALVNVVSRGIAGTEMPRSGMSPRQAQQVAAFVRSLGRAAPSAVPGDPARGAQLYAGKGGCARCHTVNGRGGALGPDLTDIGARRSVSYLRAALVDPQAAVPEGFLQVRVTTRDGRRLTGVRLNEDAFSIQLRDLSDQIHSFWKSEIAELRKDWGQSPMPGYGTLLTAAEIDDLVAYLASLQGRL
ncbi:MAG: c-type cytochrome [Acidobacteria bacterium]|nr:c-type cytochrome [Acidobacteriota bacterium]